MTDISKASKALKMVNHFPQNFQRASITERTQIKITDTGLMPQRAQFSLRQLHTFASSPSHQQYRLSKPLSHKAQTTNEKSNPPWPVLMRMVGLGVATAGLLMMVTWLADTAPEEPALGTMVRDGPPLPPMFFTENIFSLKTMSVNPPHIIIMKTSNARQPSTQHHNENK